jgi:hypothetical protein
MFTAKSEIRLQKLDQQQIYERRLTKISLVVFKIANFSGFYVLTFLDLKISRISFATYNCYDFTRIHYGTCSVIKRDVVDVISVAQKVFNLQNFARIALLTEHVPFF